MGLIVQKFGGTSVANAERVFNVANIITDMYKKGNDIIAVVSAQGQTTDELIEFYQELVNKYPIISIEDPVDENDIEGWIYITNKLKDKVQLVGDDLFVTNKYRLKKGIESISGLQTPIRATKILFSREVSKEEDDYLNFVSSGSKIIWEEEKIYLPFEVGDQTVIYNNQRVSKIKFKKLTNQYKDGLVYVSAKILDDQKETLVRKAFKKIEKGV